MNVCIVDEEFKKNFDACDTIVVKRIFSVIDIPTLFITKKQLKQLVPKEHIPLYIKPKKVSFDIPQDY